MNTAASDPDVDDGINASPGGDAAAVAIAMARASAEKADLFLERQSRYLELQMEDLHEQRELTVSHLKWRRFSDWMRAAWQGSLAIAGLSAVLFAAIGLWNAHEARGLVVRSLKTPPDFASRGLDGTVLAQRLLDKLNALVAESEPVAFHSADSIRGDWGDDSKVEIPQTGVSVDELSRALRDWLGHQTHVSGEVWRTASGIAVTARADSKVGVTVTGPEADLDRLLDRAAESVLAETQPYRYAGALVQRGSFAKAVDFLRPIARGGAPSDRPWAYSFWADTLVFSSRNREAIPLADTAIRLDPSDPSGYFSRLSAEAALSQGEATLRDTRTMARLLSGSGAADLSGVAAAVMRAIIPGAICGLTADHRCAADAERHYSELNFWGFDHADLLVASELALAHDGAAARAILASHPDWNDGTAVEYSGAVGDMMPRFFLLANTGQWALAAADAEAADRATQGFVPAPTDSRHTFVWPWLAYAWAKSGNIAGADALIAMTALDCSPCLDMRGRIAAVKHDYRAASAWFDRATRDAPSLPPAPTDWGAMLLERGDYAGAIAKFTLANRKGPHFADPLEMWGEALMLQNRSDLALVRFAEANRYAPNWGRLHLEWGEALGYLGRKDDARVQFRIASALDLSDGDRATLTRLLHR